MDRDQQRTLDASLRAATLPGGTAAVGVIALLALLEAKDVIASDETGKIIAAMDVQTAISGLPLGTGRTMRSLLRSTLQHHRSLHGKGGT